MQLRFDIWPADSSFEGVFDLEILPVHEVIGWVQRLGSTARAALLALVRRSALRAS